MHRRTPVAALLLAALAVGGAAWASDAADGFACLRESDLVCAERVRDALVKSEPDGVASRLLDARTRFFEGDYVGAAALIDELNAEGVSADSDDMPVHESAGAAQDFQSLQGPRTVVRYARGVDAVLAEEGMETLEKVRATYDALLGGGPDHRVLLDIFPDGRRFIAASGLPAEAVRTTGVVALSKWTRLLLTSPRALARGYAWKDTVAHEYIHLVVSYRTRDKAPVWLQEGLAKFLEGYWRGEKTGHLSAYQQSLLADAIQSGHFVPFEKFRLSLAYLDSGEEAALAFSQVATMVGYLVSEGGDAALRVVLDDVRRGDDPRKAVAKAAGHATWDSFTTGWQAYIATLPLIEEQLAALPVVIDGEGGDFADDPLLAERQDLARYARVGDLLREAGRPQAALVEYEKAQDPEGPPSPLLLARQATCQAALGDRAGALAAAVRGTELYPEFALLQVTRAALLEQAGRTREAVDSWRAAHDLNPFDPEVQAALVRGYRALGDEAMAKRHERYAEILATGGALGAVVDGR